MPRFQNESSRKTFDMEMSLICKNMKVVGGTRFNFRILI